MSSRKDEYMQGARLVSPPWGRLLHDPVDARRPAAGSPGALLASCGVMGGDEYLTYLTSPCVTVGRERHGTGRFIIYRDKKKKRPC